MPKNAKPKPKKAYQKGPRTVKYAGVIVEERVADSLNTNVANQVFNRVNTRDCFEIEVVERVTKNDVERIRKEYIASGGDHKQLYTTMGCLPNHAHKMLEGMEYRLYTYIEIRTLQALTEMNRRPKPGVTDAVQDLLKLWGKGK